MEINEGVDNVIENQEQTEVQVEENFENENENISENTEVEVQEGTEVFEEEVEEEKEFEEDMEKKEDYQKESFSATYKQKREALDNTLDSIIVRDEDDNLVSETWFWVMDFDDEYVMVEKYTWNNNGDNQCDYGRFSYSFDETNITASLTSEFEKMIVTWLTEEEYNKVQEERQQMSLDVEELKSKVSEFEKSIEEKDSKISELQEYYNSVESEKKESVVNELFEEFETVLKDNEEFTKLKDKAMDMEISVLEKELYALEGMVKHEVKNKEKKIKKFNYSHVSVSTVGENEVETNTDDIAEKEYGSVGKYLKKK